VEQNQLIDKLISLLENKLVSIDEIISSFQEKVTTAEKDIIKFRGDLDKLQDKLSTHADSCPINKPIISKMVSDAIIIELAKVPDKRRSRMVEWSVILATLISLVVFIFGLYESSKNNNSIQELKETNKKLEKLINR